MKSEGERAQSEGGKKQTGLLNIWFNFLCQRPDAEPNQTCKKNALLSRFLSPNHSKHTQTQRNSGAGFSGDGGKPWKTWGCERILQAQRRNTATAANWTEKQENAPSGPEPVQSGSVWSTPKTRSSFSAPLRLQQCNPVQSTWAVETTERPTGLRSKPGPVGTHGTQQLLSDAGLYTCLNQNQTEHEENWTTEPLHHWTTEPPPSMVNPLSLLSIITIQLLQMCALQQWFTNGGSCTPWGHFRDWVRFLGFFFNSIVIYYLKFTLKILWKFYMYTIFFFNFISLFTNIIF